MHATADEMRVTATRALALLLLLHIRDQRHALRQQLLQEHVSRIHQRTSRMHHHVTADVVPCIPSYHPS